MPLWLVLVNLQKITSCHHSSPKTLSRKTLIKHFNKSKQCHICNQHITISPVLNSSNIENIRFKDQTCLKKWIGKISNKVVIKISKFGSIWRMFYFGTNFAPIKHFRVEHYNKCNQKTIFFSQTSVTWLDLRGFSYFMGVFR